MELYSHQQKLLELNPKRYGIFWQGGLGKTIMALELAKKNNSRVLIVCPKLIKLTWQREVANYPMLEHKIVSKEEFRRDWDTYPKYDTICFDESHFVSHNSQMTKALAKYIKRHNPTYRYLLTGTPYSDPFSIYYQAQHLGYNWSYNSFKNTFYQFVPMGNRVIPIVRKGIEGQIKNLINTIGETLAMEDVFDIPEQLFKTEYFNLTTEQKREIKKIDESETVHIARWTKIYQLTGGTLKGDEYTKDIFVKSEKLERLIELINENDKIIVVCRFNNEIEYIKKQLTELKKPVFVINGAIKVEDKRKTIDEMAKIDQYCTLVNAMCSEGWEAPNCPLMVFYSIAFDLKNYLQMQWRIHRANHLKNNLYISLVVADTIDEDVFKTLNNKMDFHIELYEPKKLTKTTP
jgi:superfamily II DNA or RNA helicase